MFSLFLSCKPFQTALLLWRWKYVHSDNCNSESVFVSTGSGAGLNQKPEHYTPQGVPETTQSDGTKQHKSEVKVTEQRKATDTSHVEDQVQEKCKAQASQPADKTRNKKILIVYLLFISVLLTV